jgi:hypothetical protein
LHVVLIEDPMLRYLVATLAAMVVPIPVLGAPIQLISGLPDSFTPGQPVSFDVSLPAITNLGSYNIDLILESSAGTAGVDYFFDAAATLPATTHYVFSSTVNYFNSVTLDSTTRDRITLTDFDFSGLNVVSGANDQVAKVVVQTSASFHGPLSISVVAPLLILDTPNAVPTAVSGFSAIQSGVASAEPAALPEVPEPFAFALLAPALAGVLAVARYRRQFLVSGVA